MTDPTPQAPEDAGCPAVGDRLVLTVTVTGDKVTDVTVSDNYGGEWTMTDPTPQVPSAE